MKKEAREASFKENKKQLILNIVASFISFGVGIAVSFVLTPFLISKLGKEAYSFYPISTNVTNAMVVVTSALNTIASRFIAISLFNKDIRKANKYYSSTVFVDFILSIILLIVMTAFVIFINTFLSVPEEFLLSVRLLFSFVFAAAITNVMSSVFGVATFAKNRIELRSIREIGASVIRGALFIILYALLPADLSFIGLVALAVAVFNLIIQFIYTKLLMPEIRFSFKSISGLCVKELFFSSVWVIISSLGNTLISGTTLYILNKLYSVADASIVSIAITIPSFISGIITMLVGVYYPIITKRYSEGSQEELAKEIRKVQKVIGGFSCAVICVFMAMGKYFYQLWVPEENSELLYEVTFYLMAPYIPISFFWVSTYANTAMNDIKIPAIATTCFGVANILIQILFSYLKINYRFIVITSSLVQICWSGLFMPLYLSKSTKQKWNYYYHDFLKILMYSVSIFALTFCLSEFVSINSWGKFILFGGAFGLLSLIILMFVLVPYNDIKRALKKWKR